MDEIDLKMGRKLLKYAKLMERYTEFYGSCLGRRLEPYVATKGAINLKEWETWPYNTFRNRIRSNFILGTKKDFNNGINNKDKKYYIKVEHPTGAYLFCTTMREYDNLKQLFNDYLDELDKYKPIEKRRMGRDFIFKLEDGLKLLKDYPAIDEKYRLLTRKALAQAKIDRLTKELKQAKKDLKGFNKYYK